MTGSLSSRKVEGVKLKLPWALVVATVWHGTVQAQSTIESLLSDVADSADVK